MTPSAVAGQPSRAWPLAVRRTPFASARKEPVEVICNGRVPCPRSTAVIGVTGSMPRPDIERSVGLLVVTRVPFCSTLRPVVTRTPPAE